MIDPTYADELLAKMKGAAQTAASSREVKVITEVMISRPSFPSFEAMDLLELQTLINRACWGTSVWGYICPGYDPNDRIYNFIFSPKPR